MKVKINTREIDCNDLHTRNIPPYIARVITSNETAGKLIWLNRSTVANSTRFTVWTLGAVTSKSNGKIIKCK